MTNRTKKILIVEDDLGIAELLSGQLGDLGFETSPASSGKEAFVQLAENTPDLMILDYSLPDLNGIEFVNMLSDLGHTPPPYIVVTGMGDEHVAVEMMKLGAKDYIIKDVGFLDRIPAVVNRVVQDVENANRLAAAEKKLSETFKLFEAVIEQSPIGKIILSSEGNLKIINDAGRQIFGIVDNPQFIQGENFLQIEPPWREFDVDGNPVSKVDLPLDRALKGKITANMEMRIVRNDDMEKWIMASGFPIYDDQGRLIAAYSSFFDLTERKQMAEQLRQAEKMQAIGELAGGIAHDFNNQLGGIVGYAELLKEELEHIPRLKAFAGNILVASSRAADLTTQLLAFARKGKYLTTIVDLNKIVLEVVGMLRHTIDKQITVKQNLSAQCATISGDPSQIQNMLVNLGLNARDAMPEGGELVFTTCMVELDETSAHRMSPGAYVEISCSDTGCGMSEATLEHIFEPFYTTKEQGKGTGMGMAAVYGTVKAHGGGIGVESQLNVGTTVKIVMPFAPSDSQNAEKSKQTQTSIKGSAHILLVDDDLMINEYCSTVLKGLGYRVTSSFNGLEAVEVYEKNWTDIDLVILDIVMPKMNGSKAFGQMKKINPNIAALVSSGFAINAEAQSILDRGAKGFIQKPFRVAELSQAIADALAVQRSPAAVNPR